MYRIKNLWLRRIVIVLSFLPVLLLLAALNLLKGIVEGGAETFDDFVKVGNQMPDLWMGRTEDD